MASSETDEGSASPDSEQRLQCVGCGKLRPADGKLLHCLHVMCPTCLVDSQSLDGAVHCVLCRHVPTLVGLRGVALQSQLADSQPILYDTKSTAGNESVDDSSPEAAAAAASVGGEIVAVVHECLLCRDGKKLLVTFRCMDCNGPTMCMEHADSHTEWPPFAKHRIEKLVGDSLAPLHGSGTNQTVRCLLHLRHDVTSFCLDCKQVACEVCIVKGHSEHNTAPMSEAVCHARQELQRASGIPTDKNRSDDHFCGVGDDDIPQSSAGSDLPRSDSGDGERQDALQVLEVLKVSSTDSFRTHSSNEAGMDSENVASDFHGVGDDDTLSQISGGSGFSLSDSSGILLSSTNSSLSSVGAGMDGEKHADESDDGGVGRTIAASEEGGVGETASEESDVGETEETSDGDAEETDDKRGQAFAEGGESLLCSLTSDVQQAIAAIDTEMEATSKEITDFFDGVREQAEAKKQELLKRANELCWRKKEPLQSKQQRLRVLAGRYANLLQASKYLSSSTVPDHEFLRTAFVLVDNWKMLQGSMSAESGSCAPIIFELQHDQSAVKELEQALGRAVAFKSPTDLERSIVHVPHEVSTGEIFTVRIELRDSLGDPVGEDHDVPEISAAFSSPKGTLESTFNASIVETNPDLLEASATTTSATTGSNTVSLSCGSQTVTKQFSVVQHRMRFASQRCASAITLSRDYRIAGLHRSLKRTDEDCIAFADLRTEHGSSWSIIIRERRPLSSRDIKLGIATLPNTNRFDTLRTTACVHCFYWQSNGEAYKDGVQAEEATAPSMQSGDKLTFAIRPQGLSMFNHRAGEDTTIRGVDGGETPLYFFASFSTKGWQVEIC